MASLKEVRTRIASVSSTQQITSAMKLVSASKLKRAQNAILKLRPYSSKFLEILNNLGSGSEETMDNVFYKTREVKKVLLVVITSNRGLCGAFNMNVIKAVQNLIHKEYEELHKQGNVHLMCFGRKGAEFFQKRKYNVIKVDNQIFDHLTYDHAEKHANFLLNAFNDGTYDKIEIVYNQFKNAAVQVLVTEQFLPIPTAGHLDKIGAKKSKTQSTIDFIFEPEKETIFKELIPRSLKVFFYKTLLDSHTSEHGARMTSMHKATENAQEMLKDLKLMYNKVRQASITNEIMEIVGGAEALKG